MGVSLAVTKMVQQMKGFSSSKGLPTVFSISNTSKSNSDEFYLTPVRVNQDHIVCGAVVYSENIARNIAKQVDGLVDFVLVDCEKKLPATMESGETVEVNTEKVVRAEIKKSGLLSFKANDLTVDAVDAFIANHFESNLNGVAKKKMAIIGAGNIGFKLALKSVERGAQVSLFRRDSEKLELFVNAINSIKPKSTIARAKASSDITDACNGVEILVGATDGRPGIFAAHLADIARDCLVIDVGKGALSICAIELLHEKNIEVYRTDVTSQLSGAISALLSLRKGYVTRVGRAIINGVPVVSGGLLGKKGDVIVDNFRDPKQIIGVANGVGDIERKPTLTQQQSMLSLENYLCTKD
jgi:NAD(P)-dependent dehydrogenase (short-subunit alcohol dehydrogenase family)